MIVYGVYKYGWECSSFSQPLFYKLEDAIVKLEEEIAKEEDLNNRCYGLDSDDPDKEMLGDHSFKKISDTEYKNCMDTYIVQEIEIV
jgi:hypothetical protein